MPQKIRHAYIVAVGKRNRDRTVKTHHEEVGDFPPNTEDIAIVMKAREALLGMGMKSLTRVPYVRICPGELSDDGVRIVEIIGVGMKEGEKGAAGILEVPLTDPNSLIHRME